MVAAFDPLHPRDLSSVILSKAKVNASNVFHRRAKTWLAVQCPALPRPCTRACGRVGLSVHSRDCPHGGAAAQGCGALPRPAMRGAAERGSREHASWPVAPSPHRCGGNRVAPSPVAGEGACVPHRLPNALCRILVRCPRGFVPAFSADVPVVSEFDAFMTCGSNQ